MRLTCLRPALARLPRVGRHTQCGIALIFALKYDGLFPFVTVNSLFILFVIFLRFYSISVPCFLYFNKTHITHNTHSSEILAGNVQIYQKTCTQAMLILVAGALLLHISVIQGEMSRVQYSVSSTE